jgi:hypothetical protein
MDATDGSAAGGGGGVIDKVASLADTVQDDV